MLRLAARLGAVYSFALRALSSRLLRILWGDRRSGQFDKVLRRLSLATVVFFILYKVTMFDDCLHEAGHVALRLFPHDINSRRCEICPWLVGGPCTTSRLTMPGVDCYCDCFSMSLHSSKASPLFAEPPQRPIVPNTVRAKTQILFYNSFEMYSSQMERSYIALFEASRVHPEIDAVMWGPGFRHYDSTYTLSDNVQRRYGGKDHFDLVVICPFNIDRLSVYDLAVADIAPHSPILYRAHECRYAVCYGNFVLTKASILMFAYAVEVDQYRSLERTSLLLHSPHVVDTSVFHADVASQRTVDVLLPGNPGSNYPFRRRLRDLIFDGRLPGTLVRKHPGYRLQGATSEDAEGSIKFVNVVNEQYDEYARSLKQAKIVLVTSSMYRYAVLKYAEAAVAGALIIGDIPSERGSDFRRFVVEIRRTDTDEQIERTIKFWLDRPEERVARALIGQEYFLRRVAPKNAVDLMLWSLSVYQRGLRGSFVGTEIEPGYRMQCWPLQAERTYCKLTGCDK